MPDKDQAFHAFFMVWGLLAIGNFAFFHLVKNAFVKRIAWPVMIIVTSALFFGFIHYVGFPEKVLWIAGPAIVFIAIGNLNAVKFCDACGKTIWRSKPFARTTFCPACGARLDGKGDQAEAGENDE